MESLLEIYVDVHLDVVRFVTMLFILLPTFKIIKLGRKDEINAMMESIFDELKISKTKETLISSTTQEMKTLLAEELVKFKELNKQYVTSLKCSSEDLIKKYEENEQYGKRLCLRIKCILRKEKERSNEVLDQVRKLFEEANITISNVVLGRAHCVSKKNHNVIVRFNFLPKNIILKEL